MRTRTLLLLAIACGSAILIAGVVQLLRVASQDDAPTAATVGDPVRVGDMTITVERLSNSPDTATVVVDIGGVDDPDGADGFRLVVPGDALTAVSGADDACGATTVATRRCTLTFDLGGADGSSRVLLYRRGDEQARWELSSE